MLGLRPLVWVTPPNRTGLFIASLKRQLLFAQTTQEVRVFRLLPPQKKEGADYPAIRAKQHLIVPNKVPRGAGASVGGQYLKVGRQCRVWCSLLVGILKSTVALDDTRGTALHVPHKTIVVYLNW